MKKILLAWVLVVIALSTTVSAEDRSSAVIILDASGSMWGQIEGETKIAIAKDTLNKIVKDWDPQVELGLTVYGHRNKSDCDDIETLIPVGKVDKDQMLATVKSIQPKGKTPISRALQKVASELKHTEEKSTIILISDGKESCDADPCATATLLEEQGVDFVTHVIGFDVDKETKKQLQCIATNTGGQYFFADNAEQLNEALEKVTRELTTLTIKAADENGNELNEKIEWIIIHQETKKAISLIGSGTGTIFVIANNEGDKEPANNNAIFPGKLLISGSNEFFTGQKEIDLVGSENHIVKVTMEKSIGDGIKKQEMDESVTLDKTVFIVESSTVDSITLDGVKEDSTYIAKYELEAELILQGKTVLLHLSPSVKSYSEGLETLPDIIPGDWKRTYALNGEFKKSWEDKASAFFNHETLDVFIVRELLFHVPKNKLKIGERWNKKILTGSRPINVEVIVARLSDTEIAVEYSSDTTSSFQGDKIYFRNKLQGKVVYDRQTLLIKTGEMNKKSKLADTVNKNSQEISLLNEKTTAITIHRRK